MAQTIRRHRINDTWKVRGYPDYNDTQGQVTTYAAPNGSPVSDAYTVSAAGSQTACYGTVEGHFANFETTAGSVLIEITSTSAINTMTVQPNRFGITPTFTPGGNSASFTITQPQNYVVFINGNQLKPLYIFANPESTASTNPGDYTYYYGPGYYDHTRPDGSPLNVNGALVLSSGQTCYIHPEAYLKGKIHFGTDQANVGPVNSNIHLTGYGVIDSMDVATGNGPGRPGNIGNVNNATVTGPTYIGQTHWGMIIFESKNITLKNVKMLNYKVGASGTPDGIDIIGSSDVIYDTCFIRAHDDAIALKTWKSGYGPSPFYRGNVENVNINDCVIDQGDGGNGVEIGYENFNNTTSISTPVNDPATGQPIAYIRNINYRRLDIVRKRRDPSISYRMAGLGIHLVDDVPLSNVLYEDVNVDYCDGQFWIWFGAFYTGDYSYGSARAQINNVTLRRVNIDGPSSLPIHLQGGGSGKTIDNIVFEDVYVKGTKLINTSPVSGKFTWEISNVSGPNGSNPVYL